MQKINNKNSLIDNLLVLLHIFMILGQLLRFSQVVIGMGLCVLESTIYIRICYGLWKHDIRMRDKISNNDFQQRKRKNVITLSGQLISYFVELFGQFFLIAQIFNNDLADPSVMAMSFIIITTIVSMSQLWSSHELMRYIRMKIKYD